MSAGRSAESMFGCLAEKLFEVVEIDASKTLYEYEKRLIDASKLSQAEKITS